MFQGYLNIVSACSSWDMRRNIGWSVDSWLWINKNKHQGKFNQIKAAPKGQDFVCMCHSVMSHLEYWEGLFKYTRECIDEVEFWRILQTSANLFYKMGVQSNKASRDKHIRTLKLWLSLRCGRGSSSNCWCHRSEETLTLVAPGQNPNVSQASYSLCYMFSYVFKLIN